MARPKVTPGDGFIKINKDIEDGTIEYRLIEKYHEWGVRDAMAVVSSV